MSPLTFELLPPRDILAFHNMIKAVKSLIDLGFCDFTMVSRSNRATLKACEGLYKAVPVARITPHIRSCDVTEDDTYYLQRYGDAIKHAPSLFVIQGDDFYVNDKDNRYRGDVFNMPYRGEAVIALIKKFYAMGWQVSAACYPEGHPRHPNDRYNNALAKLDAGCDFLVSQVVFSAMAFDSFYREMHQRLKKLPLIRASIMWGQSVEFTQKFCIKNGITYYGSEDTNPSLFNHFVTQKIPVNIVTLNQWAFAETLAMNFLSIDVCAL